MNEYIEKAERFLLECMDPLARSYDTVSQKWVKPYPEVTGYLLSYFAETDNYSHFKVLKAAQYLLKIQHESGGFPSFDSKDILHTFDTCQIMQGFLSIYKKNKRLPAYFEAAQKCYEFLRGAFISKGVMLPAYDVKKKCYKQIYKGFYISDIGHSIQAKNIEAFKLYYEITGSKEAKEICRDIHEFMRIVPILQESHPLGYFLEGMLAYGDIATVEKELKPLFFHIQSNGFLPYYYGSSCAYVSGSAQIAIILCKMGHVHEAVAIRDWLRIVQNNHPSGGLFQYANKDGSLNTSIHMEINSWGTKYFCELERLLECENK